MCVDGAILGGNKMSVSSQRSVLPGAAELVGTPHLTLLGGFSLQMNGIEVTLAPSAQRLLAFLALHSRHPREYVASMLWPELPERHSLASLRTALWRLRSRAPGTVTADRHDLGLHPDVTVDLLQRAEAAQHLLQGGSAALTTADPQIVHSIVGWRSELLPGWYDDWVLVERERVRLLHVRALEALAEQLLSNDRASDALHAALAATALEPFRDSAHAAVLRAHLSEGNRTQAIRHYQHYRALLHDELGVQPSAGLVKLVQPHQDQRAG
jgi:DNA-binding SARP family transcriptional activator